MDCACCNKKINEWRTAVLPGGTVTWQNCYADQMMETRGYGARIDLSVASVSGAENVRMIPNPHFSLSLSFVLGKVRHLLFMRDEKEQKAVKFTVKYESKIYYRIRRFDVFHLSSVTNTQT